jgi:serine/threonine-protein kinase
VKDKTLQLAVEDGAAEPRDGTEPPFTEPAREGGAPLRAGDTLDGAAAAAANEDAPRLGPGAVLDGRYRIQSLLGEGGMGTVWRAHHLRIGRAVAVKVLNADVSRSPLEVERFRREADIAVRLSSPHVVEVLDFGEAPGGALYLVMELLQGESVRERLRRVGRLPPDEVAELLRQLMRGLDAAHRAGIVHRDLKPENLWLVPEDGRDRLKILDFGIAKVVDLPGGAERTQAGLVMGTPQFLSPEQAVGAEVDARADLYSAGIVAYLLLTGRHPFSTFDARSLLRAHAYDPVPSPARDAPELVGHPALLRFVARTTEKDRNLRAQSAGELLDVLEGKAPAGPRPGGSGAPAATASAASATRTGFLRTLSATVPRAHGLTLLVAEIADYAALSATRTREEIAALLTEHDHLVVPALRAFRGRRVSSLGASLLAAFPSPTDAVLCAMAVQDRLAARDLRADGDRLVLRIALHLGELREERGDLAGAARDAAHAVLGVAGPGEILLTRAVYLAMSRGEVRLEPLPPVELTGEQLPLYRVERSDGVAPYGGREAGRVEDAVLLTRALAPIADGLSSIGDAAAEGRLRATWRVVAAAASLAGLRTLALLARVALGLLAALRFVGWRRRPPPLWMERAVRRLERTLDAVRLRRPFHRAALLRPLT